MASMNINRQKLLWLVMRHSGGFKLTDTTNGANARQIRVDDATAAKLIGLDLNGIQRNNFEISGNVVANGIPTQNTTNNLAINLHHKVNGAPTIVNLTNKNDNPTAQLTHINWLLNKIDMSCLNGSIIQNLRKAGFVATDAQGHVTGLKITLAQDKQTLTDIRKKLAALYLMLPDLQFVHRNKMLTDKQLCKEIDEERAHYSRFNTEHSIVVTTTDNAQYKLKLNDQGQIIGNKTANGQEADIQFDQIPDNALMKMINEKINASISYGRQNGHHLAYTDGINNFFHRSKKDSEPLLKLNCYIDSSTGKHPPTGLDSITIFNNTMVQVHNNTNLDSYCGRTNHITNDMNSASATTSNHGTYEVKISHNNGTDWNYYIHNDTLALDQDSMFTKDFREWMLETFDKLLKTKTEEQKTNFYRRLYRKRGDAADQTATTPKPQAQLNKENINYILQALEDSRLLLKNSIPDNVGGDEINCKKHIEQAVTQILDRANIFYSPKQIQEKITNPESERLNSLFKLYTQDLDGEEATKRERNDFFGTRLSVNQNNGGLVYHQQHNPNGIIENYKVFQQGSNRERLVEITDRDRLDCVPENARHSIIKTTMKFKTPVAHNNTSNHTLTIDRYHKNHDNHKKNTYDIYLTDNSGQRVTQPNAKNLTLEHFLDIARTMSAKHKNFDLRKLPDTIVHIKVPGEKIIREIPAKWAMYAALRGLNIDESRIKIIPHSLAALRRSPINGGTIAGRLDCLITAIQGVHRDDAVPIMSI